ncbi:MAG: GNAT family N-acetyltransferase [Rhizobiales bacterium]|nr:GNAT family N-acetyltransferase [Hyphomicrobiales bacterium]
MCDDDAPRVVDMVRGLARQVGADAVPMLTPEALNGNRDLVDIVVAEQGGKLIGACLTLITFSTWRGAKGLYVVDLFVEPQARGNKTGLHLLKLAAARGMARGARFIKLEVDHTNERAARFYERLGFVRKDQDRLFVLEAKTLKLFVD